ncbi:putative porin [Peristeroidobacter agariperforans]|uniref:putative porin n=1 Tax=Peristeroidobacter agariperforans TaxID=268404 RepID=UPI00101BDDDE|nr:putative porin [Peristeroidobacter agariperforans]
MCGRAIAIAASVAVCLASNVYAAEATEDQAAELQSLRERVKALEERIGPDAQSSAPAAEGRTIVGNIAFSGDARYRAESIDVGDVDNDRQRVRARFGVQAKITDTLLTGLRLSTGEGDPRSAHLTFSGGYSRRSVGVDLAYLQWSIAPELRMAAGKVAYPNWQPAQSVFIGGDFSPEGWSSAYRSDSGWFANAHHFWLQTRLDAADSRQSGLQLGFASAEGMPTRLTVAGAYTDFTHVAGQKPFLDGVNPYGNSLNAGGELLTDFDVAELSSELTMKSYPGSLTAFVHLARNVAASANDTAYAAGVSMSAARLKHWRVGYHYTRIEKDALFGQLMDGDFGGGSTDSRGHAFRLSYHPAGRWSSSLSYLHNQVNISSAAPQPFDLIQLDIDFTY